MHNIYYKTSPWGRDTHARISPKLAASPSVQAWNKLFRKVPNKTTVSTLTRCTLSTETAGGWYHWFPGKTDRPTRPSRHNVWNWRFCWADCRQPDLTSCTRSRGIFWSGLVSTPPRHSQDSSVASPEHQHCIYIIHYYSGWCSKPWTILQLI